VPSAFVDLLPFAARPFTARELLERSGAPLSSSTLQPILDELRAAGIIIPAGTTADRIARATINPLQLLALPALSLPLFVVAAVGVALQLQTVLYFEKVALHQMRGAFVVPFVVAIVVLPPARALFRAQLLQRSARRVRARLHGVIPTWELEHPAPTTRIGK